MLRGPAATAPQAYALPTSLEALLGAGFRKGLILNNSLQKRWKPHSSVVYLQQAKKSG